jgi:predicted dehydrogenase
MIMYNRRKFMKYSGILAGGAMLTTPIRGASRSVSPQDKITVALIGCNGMGMYNLNDMLKVPGVVCGALCDVDENVLNKRAVEIEKSTGVKPALFKDYRKVLDAKDIDAVIIATPDHWHCLIAVDACRAGKDVYIEKPLANAIAECDAMVDASRKYKRVMQVGQQQRSGQHWQDAVALVQSGKLGTIRKIKTWAYFDYAKGKAKVADTAVPAGVDYDMWLGPSPKTPFNANRFHGSWRLFWNQGGGLMTDWGVHLLDIPLWAMKVTTPKAVSSYGGIYAYPDNAVETADTQSVIYDFGNFLLEWDHNAGISKGLYGKSYGVAFIGTNGTLVANREGWEVMAESENGTTKIESMSLQAPDKEDHLKHVTNFIDCIKSRATPVCDVVCGKNSAVLAHMGNIAYRTGNKLVWSPEKKMFLKDDRANELIKPTYRTPWKFPVIV